MDLMLILKNIYKNYRRLCNTKFTYKLGFYNLHSQTNVNKGGIQ